MDIVMPQMGESLAEGTVVRWLKNIGDIVAKDEPLLEIETDKVETVVDSPATGTIGQIVVDEGVTVPVGAVLATLIVVGETVQPRQQSEHDHGARSAAHFGGADSAIAVSFETRRRSYRRSAEPHAADHLPQIPPEYLYTPSSRDRVVPMSPTRRRISEHMSWSRRIAAHATVFDEVEVGAASDWLEGRRDREPRLTWTALIAHATVVSLARFPTLNSAVVDGSIAVRPYVNLGIAVAVDGELVVPVVADAHRDDLDDLAMRITDLTARARSKQLQPHEVRGGSFTYSNPGIAGGLFGTPILNQPQVGILSTNAVRQRPWVIDGQVVARPVMGVSLSFDHRAIDGLMGFQFVAAFGEMLADPVALARSRASDLPSFDTAAI
jgi:2-oxoglutarate dehydrogenase E2 component (dihydrolipoamide succinyltransferase)/2-oxoisovalerate dehydrogenase E2 component (dihydrolipoyl transacylase)